MNRPLTRPSFLEFERNAHTKMTVPVIVGWIRQKNPNVPGTTPGVAPIDPNDPPPLRETSTGTPSTVKVCCTPSSLTTSKLAVAEATKQSGSNAKPPIVTVNFGPADRSVAA